MLLFQIIFYTDNDDGGDNDMMMNLQGMNVILSSDDVGILKRRIIDTL